jgi:hypothetical protein
MRKYPPCPHTDEPTLDLADATMMLVARSGFVSYPLAKATPQTPA